MYNPPYICFIKDIFKSNTYWALSSMFTKQMKTTMYCIYNLWLYLETDD